LRTEARKVVLGVVLPHVELQIRDPARMPFVEREWRRSKSVADMLHDLLRHLGYDRADAQRQERSVAPGSVASVDRLRGGSQGSAGRV
jgi:hypothetical protein